MKRRGIILLVVLLLACVGVVVTWFIQNWRSLEPQTDVAAYPKVLAELKADGWQYVSHIPPAVPQAASNVSFYFQRGFGQGGQMLELRFTLPPGQADALAQQNGIPATRPSRTPEFPSMRKISPSLPRNVLSSSQTNAGNNGHSTGIAVDPMTGEIVYWSEEW